MTTVVNLHYEKCDQRIDRKSIWGNPFIIGIHGDRDQVIEKYKVWFYNKLNDLAFKSRTLKLKDKILGCHCRPLKCHGEIIADYLNSL